MCNFEKNSLKLAKRNLLDPFCQSIQIISKIEEKKILFFWRCSQCLKDIKRHSTIKQYVLLYNNRQFLKMLFS